MNDTVQLVALNLGFTAVGAAIVLMSGFPRGWRWLPTVAGLAPVAGIATCGLLASVGAMIGIDVSPLSTGLLAVDALLVACLRRPTLAAEHRVALAASPG